MTEIFWNKTYPSTENCYDNANSDDGSSVKPYTKIWVFSIVKIGKKFLTGIR